MKRLGSGGKRGIEGSPARLAVVRLLDDDDDAVAVTGAGASLRPPRSHHGRLSPPNERLLSLPPPPPPPPTSSVPLPFDDDDDDDVPPPPDQPTSRPGTGGETTVLCLGLSLMTSSSSPPPPPPRRVFPSAFPTPPLPASSVLGALRVPVGGWVNDVMGGSVGQHAGGRKDENARNLCVVGGMGKLCLPTLSSLLSPAEARAHKAGYSETYETQSLKDKKHR